MGQAQSPASRYNYEWAFARADRALRDQFTQAPPPKRPQEQLAKLANLPEGEQIRRVRAGGHFANPEIVQDLMGRSHSARYRSPRKTLHLALLARLAADACTADKAGSQEKLAELQVQAWGAFANAQRISGDLLAAEKAFAIAFQKEQSGTCSPQVHATLLSQLCSLRISQRSFEAALDLALEAEGICGSIEKNSLLASALVLKGTALLYSGQAEKAVDTLQQASRRSIRKRILSCFSRFTITSPDAISISTSPMKLSPSSSRLATCIKIVILLFSCGQSGKKDNYSGK